MLPTLGVVIERLPVLLRDLGDRGLDVLLLAHPDRIGPASARWSRAMIFVFQNPESARATASARGRPRNTRDELLDEPQRTAGGVRRALPGADVQHLASP